MADLSLDLCGVKLKNPIIAASGTFGLAASTTSCTTLAGWAAFPSRGSSLLPRTGNPPSRIAETPSGMLNSVGLQNPGVESFIENDLPWLLTKDVAVIANITGTSVEQYVQMAERLAGTRRASAGNEHLLPERARGRRGLRREAGERIRHHQGRQGGGEAAADRQADPERIRHHGERAGRRSRRARTRFP